MLPNLGQGGCQAIEDAAALSAALAGGAPVPDALGAYERRAAPGPRTSPASRAA